MKKGGLGFTLTYKETKGFLPTSTEIDPKYISVFKKNADFVTGTGYLWRIFHN